MPPHFPDQPIVDYIMLNHGQIEKSYRMKDMHMGFELELGFTNYKEKI